jgi:DNA-binding XRE family transcriptional regulator
LLNIPGGNSRPGSFVAQLHAAIAAGAMKQTSPKPGFCQIPIGQSRDRVIAAMTVRMVRAALGWSQFEFGRVLGMSQRAIHQIEQGHSEPRRTTLLAIESLLNKAGFEIENRSDGGFCIIVRMPVSGETGDPVEVVAPSLSDCSVITDESDPTAHAPSGMADLAQNSTTPALRTFGSAGR